MTSAPIVGGVRGRPLTVTSAGPRVQMQTVTQPLNSQRGEWQRREGAGREEQTTEPTASVDARGEEEDGCMSVYLVCV